MINNYAQQQDRVTRHQYLPSKLGSFFTLFLLFCAIFSIAGWIVSHDYMIDWDTLRYAINVKITHRGDTFFSYPHNLLKTYIYSIAIIIKSVTNTFEPLYAANILTIFCSAFSSFFLFLITKKITGNLFLSLVAATLWFLVPVNCYHIIILEDNVWANAFNALSLYFMILLYTSKELSPDKKIILSVLCGLFLSVGINVHQQLVPVFYLFLVASVFFFYRKKILLGKILLSFLLSYFLCSFIQNYLSFGKIEVIHTARRLFQQPYAHVFPQIWFFSSDDTTLQWAGKILDGIKNSFFVGGKDIPVIFILLIPLTFYVCLQVIFTQMKEKKNISLSFQIILFLLAATFIHVPHTLVYEPWNPERWDVITPSFIVLFVYSLHILSLKLRDNLKSFGYILSSVVIISLLTFTAKQDYTYFSKMITWFQQSEANRSFPHLISYLAEVKKKAKNDLKNHIVLLPPAMRWFGFEERVTYYFPNVLTVTLDNNLNILYSSSEQQFWNKPFAKTIFPKNTFQPENTFHIMPVMWKNFKKAAPVFLKEHNVHLIPIEEYK
jgi:hypothetical protein